METKVILHNSISLDGSFIGLTPNMGLHYQIVNYYKPDAYMVGYNTAKVGLEMFGQPLQSETELDFKKPNKDKSLSYWVIPDSKGILKGQLHSYRRFEFCRDVIILVSKSTPADYLSYLNQRQYDYIIAGKKYVDYKDAIVQLSEKHSVRNILVDTGSTLGNILLNNGLVDEISLIISPEIVGKQSKSLFENIEIKINLQCKNCELMKDGYIWITYKVVKDYISLYLKNFN